MTTYFKQGLDVTGNVNLTGNITVGGDQNFGDANTDSITFTADITSNIVPDASDTYDLGLTGQRWRTLYGKDVILDGDITVGGVVAASSGNLEIRSPGSLSIEVAQQIYISPNTKIIFEGTTVDNFETKLSVTDPTADRDAVFPDESGNVVLDTATQTLTNKTLGALVGTVDQITAAGAIDITTYITEITTTAATAYTLADGVLGQFKIISLIVDGGDATITPDTFATGTTITMADVNDNITLLYTTNGWTNTANQGSIIA